MLGYKKGSKPNIFDSAIHNAQVSKIFGQHIANEAVEEIFEFLKDDEGNKFLNRYCVIYKFKQTVMLKHF